jgi:hypothetical protein
MMIVRAVFLKLIPFVTKILFLQDTFVIQNSVMLPLRKFLRMVAV